MSAQFKTIDEIIRAGYQQAEAFLPANASKETKDTLQKIQSYDQLVSSLRDDGKMPEDLAQTVASATVWGILEKFGIDPNEWQLTVSLPERGKVKYGIDEFAEARKFLGSWTALGELALFIASVASVLTAGLGVFVAGSVLKGAAVLIRAGTGTAGISNFLRLESLRSIKWLSIPAITGAIATAWAYFANTQITATGDLTTYVKQGVARGEEEIRKAEAKLTRADNGFASGTTNLPKIIIRMAETSKPQIFTGVLFSAPLSKTEAFDRVIDDEITDLADLQNDLKLNMAKWIKSLGGRVSVAIAVRNNPIISATEKLAGTWIVASLSYNVDGGGRVFLETIPLGPINPVKYMPKAQEVRTIEQQTFGELKFENVKEILIPPGALNAIDKTGNIIPIPLGAVSGPLPFVKQEIAVQAPTIAPAPPVSQQDFRERGLSVPPGTPSREFLQAQTISTPPAIVSGNKPGAFKAGDMVKIVGTEGAGLNMRATSSLSGQKIISLPEGMSIQITGLWTEADGHVWWPVVFGASRGYMSGSYLRRI